MNFFQQIYHLYYKPKIFFPKKSYSMFNEDTFINNYFKKNYGIFIDIGCYHPLEGNNTYLLYKRGWRGINIDINQCSIDLFKIKRPEDTNVRAAISNKIKDKQKFYYRKKINMLNTLDLKTAKKNFPNGFFIDYLKSDTLNNVIKNSKYRNSQIDLINLDIEGLELSALSKFNFNKYKPKLICVEIHHQLDNYKNKEVYRFLKAKKYNVVFKQDYSFIFELKIFKNKDLD